MSSNILNKLNERDNLLHIFCDGVDLLKIVQEWHLNIHFTSIARNIKSLLRPITDSLNLTKLCDFINSKMDINSTSFSIPLIGTESVTKYLSKMSSNKATGIDGISTNLRKIGIKELATTKEFPTDWKTARVAALFKAGDLNW